MAPLMQRLYPQGILEFRAQQCRQQGENNISKGAGVFKPKVFILDI